MKAHIALLTVEFHIPESQSLKSKRWVLKSLKDRIHSKFNVSICETDGQDKWQKAALGICMIGTDKAIIDAALQNIVSLIDSVSDIRVLSQNTEFI